MDMDLGKRRVGVFRTEKGAALILLDTNALLWLSSGHRRSKPLTSLGALYISPATLFEVELLVEARRLTLRTNATVNAFSRDPRWLLDNPPSVSWFERARELRWTRDPFDRLIAGHAVLRGWKLATADAVLIEHLGPDRTVEL